MSTYSIYGVTIEKSRINRRYLDDLRRFLNNRLTEVPKNVKNGIKRTLQQAVTVGKARNDVYTELREVSRLVNLMPKRSKFAKSVRQVYGNHYPLHDKGHLTAWEKTHAKYVTEQLAAFNGDIDSLKPMYDVVCEYVTEQGVQPAKAATEGEPTETVLPALLRMTNRDWWKRKGQRNRRVYLETMQIIAGNVHKKKSPYLSKDALREIHTQDYDNDIYAKLMEVVSDDGEAVALDEVIKGSVANPEIRRLEMMVRAKGLEQLSDDLGYSADFLTITCPSKFHRWKYEPDGKTYTVNPKWIAAEAPQPKDAQQYLTKVWSRIRAKLKREEISYFGLRVAEAHHEGCPHWHMLIFTHPDQRDGALQIIRDYTTREEMQELIDDHARRQAKIAERKAKGLMTSQLEKVKNWYQPRFDVEPIDPEKGSAVGYVAKYISKNINGQHMTDKDNHDQEADTDAQTGADAVSAWARWHCIRQFQFFGTSSVTLWRELRRVREPGTSKVEPLRAAADSGNWRLFQNTAQALAAELVVDKSELNQFGEKQRRVLGVSVGSDILITKPKRWSLRQRGEGLPPRTRVNNCTGSLNPPDFPGKSRFSFVIQKVLDHWKTPKSNEPTKAPQWLTQLSQAKQELQQQCQQNNSQAPPLTSTV